VRRERNRGWTRDFPPNGIGQSEQDERSIRWIDFPANGVVRQCARRGTRPRRPADQRYSSAYLFGAICPARGTGAALAMPTVDTEAMQEHIDEISRHVARGAHAVLIMDRAGWHTTARLKIPKTVAPIFLPSRALELNPVENPRVKPAGRRLAVPTQQLAVEPGLRRRRRDH
jgi:hypothetical protein